MNMPAVTTLAVCNAYSGSASLLQRHRKGGRIMWTTRMKLQKNLKRATGTQGQRDHMVILKETTLLICGPRVYITHVDCGCCWNRKAFGKACRKRHTGWEVCSDLSHLSQGRRTKTERVGRWTSPLLGHWSNTQHVYIWKLHNSRVKQVMWTGNTSTGLILITRMWHYLTNQCLSVETWRILSAHSLNLPVTVLA